MPWNTCDTMKLKRDFVELAARQDANMRDICRRFGISAPTGYKWLGRYREEGLDGLVERPRTPRASPGKTGTELESLILGVREAHPAWGGRKIRRWLQDRGTRDVPSASTVTEVLRRHGRLAPPSGPSGKGWTRFEKDKPNELWQMDFKGWIRTENGGPCHPLTLLDDHSRYNLLLEACGRETMREVKPLLERAFGTYGLPSAILCDNGAPWGDPTGSFTKFEIWLMRLGVKVYHGRPRHPQTQGKEERFHRTLKAEVLSRTTVWRDLGHCQERFQEWRGIYNHERPHEALGGDVPVSRYRVSERALPLRMPAAGEWYGEGDLVKKVSGKGAIFMGGALWSIGEGFSGEEVALRRTGEDRYEVYYCWQKLGVLNPNNPPEKGKVCYRLLTERLKRRQKTNDSQP
jgi:transposase InsO family protein